MHPSVLSWWKHARDHRDARLAHFAHFTGHSGGHGRGPGRPGAPEAPVDLGSDGPDASRDPRDSRFFGPGGFGRGPGGPGRGRGPWGDGPPPPHHGHHGPPHHGPPHDGPPHHGPPGRFGGGGGDGDGGFGVRRPLRFLAHKLDLSESQVPELARILDELKTERAQGEVDLRRTTTAFADAVENGTFDEARAREGGDLRIKSAERLRDAVLKSLSRIHAMLDDDQRKRFSYLIRTGVVSL